MTSTAGDLTLRTGDLLAGKDEERVRVTADGKVGVGTSQPEAALDVAGEVRARDGVRFADGSKLAVDERGALARTSATGERLPPFGGSFSAAIPNRLAKYADAAGTLTDSAVFESGGFVGVGTSAPEGTLHIETPATTVFKVVTSGSVGTGRAVFQMYRGAAANANGWDFGYNTDLGSEAFVIRELTNGAPTTRFTLQKNTGNIGIGTTTPQARLHVVGTVNFTGLRTESNATSPNVVGGASVNAATAGVVGATIGGGGKTATDGLPANANRVTDDYGTVGGGVNNRAGDDAGATSDSGGATVGGGEKNIASGLVSTIGGGIENIASGPSSTVGGGVLNTAGGHWSTVPGGLQNTAQGNFSFAAGQRAKALHDGSFVWSDSTLQGNNFFSSTGANQFLINVAGGVGIGTNDPKAKLHVQGGNVYVGAGGQGVILKSPDGTVCRLLSIDNAGGLVISTITCP